MLHVENCSINNITAFQVVLKSAHSPLRAVEDSPSKAQLVSERPLVFHVYLLVLSPGRLHGLHEAMWPPPFHKRRQRQVNWVQSKDRYCTVRIAVPPHVKHLRIVNGKHLHDYNVKTQKRLSAADLTVCCSA